ncbi:MAG: class D sortase [Candidatus Erginobacter occultus]|nr:class D sortase [Candidatus Erginobacter occultus]
MKALLNRRLLAVGQYLFFLLAAVLLLPPLGRYGSRVYGRFRDRAVWREYRQDPARPARPGDPGGWLTVPAAGIDRPVFWGDTRENLLRGPCLVEPPSAGPGNLRVISAHRDLDFRGLEKLSPGDTVRLELPGAVSQDYRVSEIEILSPAAAADRLREKAGEDWLVLLTCHPFRYLGPAPRRFLAWAKAAGG